MTKKYYIWNATDKKYEFYRATKNGKTFDTGNVRSYMNKDTAKIYRERLPKDKKYVIRYKDVHSVPGTMYVENGVAKRVGTTVNATYGPRSRKARKKVFDPEIVLPAGHGKAYNPEAEGYKEENKKLVAQNRRLREYLDLMEIRLQRVEKEAKPMPKPTTTTKYLNVWWYGGNINCSIDNDEESAKNWAKQSTPHPDYTFLIIAQRVQIPV